MIRKMVQIDEARCIGCGLCANACKENAIVIEGGKARLIRDDYCDGLGNCLPACPVEAISIVERESVPFDEAAVLQHQAVLAAEKKKPVGCPGARMRLMDKPAQQHDAQAVPSELRQWPVQIKLAGAAAPYFRGCDLLIAADCTAYAYGNFHRDFMRGRVTLIGCPKLDEVDYSDKLTDIFTLNEIRSVTVVRMEVPCCGGLQRAVERAIAASGRLIALQVVTITADGSVLPR